jgi:magnesium chelatase family protein
VEYPASFTLIAAVNPCPCGYLGHPKRECKCTEKQIRKYRGRMSGPILDRIDLHVKVPMVEIEKLTQSSEIRNQNLSENSKTIREKVISARKIQEKRFDGQDVYTNSQMKNKHVRKYCQLDTDTERILRLAVEKFDLSARAYFRLIKVARTIADLEGVKNIQTVHMAEALQYRQIN